MRKTHFPATHSKQLSQQSQIQLTDFSNTLAISGIDFCKIQNSKMGIIRKDAHCKEVIYFKKIKIKEIFQCNQQRVFDNDISVIHPQKHIWYAKYATDHYIGRVLQLLSAPNGGFYFQTKYQKPKKCNCHTIQL